jgi:hypothetical protein
MEQWVQYIVGVGIMVWFFKELIKRMDKQEKAIDNLGTKLEVSINLVHKNFRTVKRCDELRELGKCGCKED